MLTGHDKYAIVVNLIDDPKPFFKEHPKMVKTWTDTPSKNARGAADYFCNKENFHTPSKKELRRAAFRYRWLSRWNRLIVKLFTKVVALEPPQKGSPVLKGMP